MPGLSSARRTSRTALRQTARRSAKPPDRGDPICRRNGRQRFPQRPCKEIEHSQQTGGHAGPEKAQLEIVGEVQRRHVVDRDFNAETGSIGQRQGPHPVILAGRPEGPVRLLGCRQFARARSWAKFPSGASWSGSSRQFPSADKADRPRTWPLASRFAGLASGPTNRANRPGMSILVAPAAQVSPAGRCGVGRAHAVGGEHDRHMVLRNHERGPDPPISSLKKRKVE